MVLPYWHCEIGVYLDHKVAFSKQITWHINPLHFEMSLRDELIERAEIHYGLLVTPFCRGTRKIELKPMQLSQGDHMDTFFL